jgi:hypothetical protein
VDESQRGWPRAEPGAWPWRTSLERHQKREGEEEKKRRRLRDETKKRRERESKKSKTADERLTDDEAGRPGPDP